MNDKDYIRVGVELAENFWGTSVQAYGPSGFHRPYASFEVDSPDTRMFLAALAAQLRRQVRAAGYFVNISGKGAVKIIEFTPSGAPLEREHTIAEAFADDEAMNTFKAVVDSKALEK